MPNQSISLRKLCHIASIHTTKSRGGAPKLCYQCSRIQFRLEQGIPVSDEIVYLGPLRRIKDRKDCPLCRLVVQSLSSGDTTTEKDDLQCTLNPRHDCGEAFALCVGDGPSPTLKAWIRIECSPGILNEFFSGSSSTPIFGTYNLEDTMEKALTIDAKKVQSWLQECEREHGAQCDGDDIGPEINATEDMLLIDVVEEKLVDGDQSSRYIALSYVWGDWGGESVSLGSWNSSDFLRTKGALGSSRLRLPHVLRDAMDFTQSIGERYLWCDALCVFQESFAQKAQQIAQMDIIYHRALLTIIALNGKHGNEPLPGIRQGSRSPAILVSEAGRGLRFIARVPSVAVLAERSVYESRAWTFQERLLSTRCLFMTESQAFFCCALKCFREDEIMLDFPDQRAQRLSLYSHKSSLGTMIKNLNGFSLYSNLVNDYTGRSLTNPGDILNAFEGISKWLERHFGSPFIKGLPLAYFHDALLWAPHSTIQNRSDLAINSSTPVCMPSWSWAACMGQVCYDGPTPTSPTSAGEVSYKLQPVVFEFLFIDWSFEPKNNGIFDPIFQGLRLPNDQAQHYRDEMEVQSTYANLLINFVEFGFFFIRRTEVYLLSHVEELRIATEEERLSHIMEWRNPIMTLEEAWTRAAAKIDEFLDSHAWMFAMSPFLHVPSRDELALAIHKYDFYNGSTREITGVNLDFWPFYCSNDRQQDRNTTTIPCTSCKFQKDTWPFLHVPSLATLRERLQDCTSVSSITGLTKTLSPQRLCFWAHTSSFAPFRLRGGQLYQNNFSASSYLTTGDGAIQCDVTRLKLASDLGVAPGQQMQPATVLWDASLEPCGIVLDNENACISRMNDRPCHLYPFLTVG